MILSLIGESTFLINNPISFSVRYNHKFAVRCNYGNLLYISLFYSSLPFCQPFKESLATVPTDKASLLVLNIILHKTCSIQQHMSSEDTNVKVFYLLLYYIALRTLLHLTTELHLQTSTYLAQTFFLYYSCCSLGYISWIYDFLFLVPMEAIDEFLLTLFVWMVVNETSTLMYMVWYITYFFVPIISFKALWQ